MKTTTNKKRALMSGRRIVEQSIDRTKSNKKASWHELLEKSNDSNSKYPVQQCDEFEPEKAMPAKE